MKNASLSEVQQRIESKATFVLNIIADWCPDCYEKQAAVIDGFADTLSSSGLDLVQLSVQKERRVYLDEEHETFVDSLGGHGFPRTVLFEKGEAVDTNNVEVFTESGLQDLADKFIKLLAG